MFISQLGKSVIGGDKEIVSADTVAVCVWWPMCCHPFGQSAPLQLLFVVKLLPGFNGPLVESLLFQLLCSTGKLGIWFAPEIADAVPMVIGNLTYRGPAV